MASSTLAPPEPRRTFAADRQAGRSTVPAEALRITAGPLALAAKADEATGQHPVKMRARSAEPIDHWYWGPIVHDMAGFTPAAPTIPIDYCHLDTEVLGFLDQFAPSDDGLDVAGAIVPFGADDRASEILHKARGGVPYQASIFFDYLSFEELQAGGSASVNGKQLAGPALIVRQWRLRGVAVCPYGYDHRTSTQLSAGQAGEIPVPFNRPPQETAMSTEAKPAPAPSPSPQPAELSAQGNLSPANSPPAGPQLTDPLTEFRAQVKRYTDAFGAENGLKWFNEALSFEAALGKHVEALAAQHASQLAAKDATIAAQKADLDAANKKLAAIPRGEADPVSFAAGDKHEAGASVDPSKLEAKLGKNLAQVAAGFKLPARQ